MRTLQWQRRLQMRWLACFLMAVALGAPRPTPMLAADQTTGAAVPQVPTLRFQNNGLERGPNGPSQPTCRVTARLLDAATREPYRPPEDMVLPSSPTRGLWGNELIGVRAAGRARGGQWQSEISGPCGSDGRLIVEGVDATTTDLEVTATGYLPVVLNSLSFEAGQTKDLGDLLLNHGTLVTGTLIDRSTGKVPEHGRWPEVQIEVEGRTTVEKQRVSADRDSGWFIARPVAGKVVAVKVMSGYYLPWELKALPVPDVRGRLDMGRVDLDPGATVEGLVVDERSAPCVRAQVFVNKIAPDGQLEHGGMGSLTSPNGTFHMGGLTAGRYRATVTHPDFPPAVLESVELGTDGPARPRIVMGDGLKVRGRLVDGKGGALEGWRVYLTDARGYELPEYREGPRQIRTAAGTGAFEIDGLPVGTSAIEPHFEAVILLRQPDPDSPTAGAVPVGDLVRALFRAAPVMAGSGDVVFKLPLTTMIAGQIVDAQGLPVSGAKVQYSTPPRSGDAPLAATQAGATTGSVVLCTTLGVSRKTLAPSDEAGRFRLGPVPPGPGTLKISGKSFVQTSHSVAVEEREELDIGQVVVARERTLVARLLDKRTGAPPEGGRLSARASVSLGRDYLDVPCEISNGTARIGGVPASGTTLHLFVSGYLTCTIEVPRGADGAETDLGVLTLDPGLTLRVRLAYAGTREPVDGKDNSVCVTIKKAAAETQSSGYIGSGLDKGLFVLTGLDGTVSRVTIEAPQCEPVEIGPLPAPDAKGVVDLGNVEVRPKSDGPLR